MPYFLAICVFLGDSVGHPLEKLAELYLVLLCSDGCVVLGEPLVVIEPVLNAFAGCRVEVVALVDKLHGGQGHGQGRVHSRLFQAGAPELG